MRLQKFVRRWAGADNGLVGSVSPGWLGNPTGNSINRRSVVGATGIGRCVVRQVAIHLQFESGIQHAAAATCRQLLYARRKISLVAGVPAVAGYDVLPGAVTCEWSSAGCGAVGWGAANSSVAGSMYTRSPALSPGDGCPFAWARCGTFSQVSARVVPGVSKSRRRRVVLTCRGEGKNRLSIRTSGVLSDKRWGRPRGWATWIFRVQRRAQPTVAGISTPEGWRTDPGDSRRCQVFARLPARV